MSLNIKRHHPEGNKHPVTVEMETDVGYSGGRCKGGGRGQHLCNYSYNSPLRTYTLKDCVLLPLQSLFINAARNSQADGLLFVLCVRGELPWKQVEKGHGDNKDPAKKYSHWAKNKIQKQSDLLCHIQAMQEMLHLYNYQNNISLILG